MGTKCSLGDVGLNFREEQLFEGVPEAEELYPIYHALAEVIFGDEAFDLGTVDGIAEFEATGGWGFHNHKLIP